LRISLNYRVICLFCSSVASSLKRGTLPYRNLMRIRKDLSRFRSSNSCLICYEVLVTMQCCLKAATLNQLSFWNYSSKRVRFLIASSLV
jgi:hypothetical protein